MNLWRRLFGPRYRMGERVRIVRSLRPERIGLEATIASGPIRDTAADKSGPTTVYLLDICGWHRQELYRFDWIETASAKG